MKGPREAIAPVVEVRGPRLRKLSQVLGGRYGSKRHPPKEALLGSRGSLKGGGSNRENFGVEALVKPGPGGINESASVGPEPLHGLGMVDDRGRIIDALPDRDVELPWLVNDSALDAI